MIKEANMTKTQRAIIMFFDRGRTIKNGVPFSKKGTRLSFSVGTNGYYRVGVQIDGNALSVPIHRLVAYSKYGDKIFEKGIQVRHLDNNRMNNRPENISIGTRMDNIQDTPTHVRKKWFKKKYNDNFVYFEFIKTGSYKHVTKKMGISRNGIKYIMHKKDRLVSLFASKRYDMIRS